MPKKLHISQDVPDSRVKVFRLDTAGLVELTRYRAAGLNYRDIPAGATILRIVQDSPDETEEGLFWRVTVSHPTFSHRGSKLLYNALPIDADYTNQNQIGNLA
jgi:hypothetical protein